MLSWDASGLIKCLAGNSCHSVSVSLVLDRFSREILPAECFLYPFIEVWRHCISAILGQMFQHMFWFLLKGDFV